jgi:galactose mutarotase-like enzyme
MEQISYNGQTLTRWRVGNSTFLALPEHGARLINWNVTLGDGSVRDVIYWPENADFSNIAKVRGGNPILFPFAGRCFDEGEIFFWRGPDGVRRPMPMHGVARQGVFHVAHADARGFVATFVPGAEAQTAYPFKYEFAVTYRFEPFGFTCELALTNHGTEPLPWSPGHHFYFTVPWEEGTARSDYLIRIPAGKRLKQDSTGMLVPGPVLQQDEKLSNPDLVDTFHTQLRGNSAVFGQKGKAGDVVVRLGVQDVPPPDATFITWAPAPDTPYYCVEPWMGPANAPGTKVGLRLVPKGETDKFVVSIQVK